MVEIKLPGSIKGDVKRKHFSLRGRGRSSLASSPRLQRHNSLPERDSQGPRPSEKCRPHKSSAWFRAASLRLQAACWQLPTMVLSETRGLLLCWVVRGSIRCPVRLLRLNPAWILTLEPERSVTVGPHHHGSAFRGPCALKLLVASDARRRTLLLSSRSSARWRRSCVPASSAPSLAACLWPAAPDKTRETLPRGYWP